MSFKILLLVLAVVQYYNTGVEAICCRAISRRSHRCGDCTYTSAYCATGPCNIVGCNCDGVCRDGSCGISTMRWRRSIEAISRMYETSSDHNELPADGIAKVRLSKQNISLYNHDAASIILAGDTNQDGDLSIAETVEYISHTFPEKPREQIEAEVKALDINGDGILTAEEIDP